jgi:hypothetical protein
MNLDKINRLYMRPNNNNILAAPANTTGGAKGIVAGIYIEYLNSF